MTGQLAALLIPQEAQRTADGIEQLRAAGLPVVASPGHSYQLVWESLGAQVDREALTVDLRVAARHRACRLAGLL